MTSTLDASAAGTWTLGTRTVNRLGLGAMRLTGTAAFDLGGRRDRATSIRVLRQAVELGVDHIDTAAFYFSPWLSANQLIHQALAPYDDDLTIVTKVGPGRDPSGEWTAWARPDQLRGQVEQNLRELGRDHLDVVNYRHTGPSKPVADHVGALAALVDDGLVRHVGISNVTAEQVDHARAVTEIVCVQNRYAVACREAGAREVLDHCGKHGIAFVPFFTIAGDGQEGRPAADASTADAVQAVAEQHAVSPAQIRLAWSLAQGPHVLAIPGTGDPAHLQDNIAAASLRLTDADLRALDALG
ncbi:aldo/keto reductase [Luteipulveratus flavus]|uniref:Aldo/keto reductase n=1 Tax=Luteipulveratus flavus TaxID=3031728 RepID=A0ABT6CCF2_9MICO|nr:aldo/keto reductase [Luteipulveratus sp. YIM 133296]MDF8266470.1 aldo/keto reductase [Luteipulveratus sp. YIM 133296]